MRTNNSYIAFKRYCTLFRLNALVLENALKRRRLKKPAP